MRIFIMLLVLLFTPGLVLAENRPLGSSTVQMYSYSGSTKVVTIGVGASAFQIHTVSGYITPTNLYSTGSSFGSLTVMGLATLGTATARAITTTDIYMKDGATGSIMANPITYTSANTVMQIGGNRGAQINTTQGSVTVTALKVKNNLTVGTGTTGSISYNNTTKEVSVGALAFINAVTGDTTVTRVNGATIGDRSAKPANFTAITPTFLYLKDPTTGAIMAYPGKYTSSTGQMSFANGAFLMHATTGQITTTAKATFLNALLNSVTSTVMYLGTSKTLVASYDETSKFINMPRPIQTSAITVTGALKAGSVTAEDQTKNYSLLGISTGTIYPPPATSGAFFTCVNNNSEGDLYWANGATTNVIDTVTRTRVLTRKVYDCTASRTVGPTQTFAYFVGATNPITYTLNSTCNVAGWQATFIATDNIVNLTDTVAGKGFNVNGITYSGLWIHAGSSFSLLRTAANTYQVIFPSGVAGTNYSGW